MIVLYVYFKAGAAEAGEVARALESLLARVQAAAGVPGRAGRRLDDRRDGGDAITWLECYEVPDEAALARLRTALADALREPECAPLATRARHDEVFRLGEPGRCA